MNIVRNTKIILQLMVLISCLVIEIFFSGIFTTTVFAAEYGDLTYTIVNEEVAITQCDQHASGRIHIPSKLEGYPVTRIFSFAFINCTKVTHIYIPSSVTIIELGAFPNVTNLKGIYVDDENQNYCSNNGVLYNKDITELILAPRTLTEYTIPDSVKQIGDDAFNGCKNLSIVNIGDNVTSIGRSAFSECKSLVSISIPNSVKTIGDGAFYRCTELKDVKFGDSVTELGEYAFNYCYALETVVLPDSVTNINRAFNQCESLISINLGKGVESLSYRAFWGNSNLASVTFGSNFRYVGLDAFEGCGSLTNVYYYGTEEQWEKVYKSDGNFYLTNRAAMHYIPSLIIGDVNNDGRFNVADVITLQKWLLGVPNIKLESWENGDFTDNEKLDVLDLCLMKRELLKSKN